MKTSPIRENSIRKKGHVSYFTLISDHGVPFIDIYSRQCRNKTTYIKYEYLGNLEGNR